MWKVLLCGREFSLINLYVILHINPLYIILLLKTIKTSPSNQHRAYDDCLNISKVLNTVSKNFFLLKKKVSPHYL